MDTQDFITPTAAAIEGAHDAPPPPKKPPAVRHLNPDGNNSVHITEAESSTPAPQKGADQEVDSVLQLYTPEELQKQITHLQGELSRRQAKVLQKQPFHQSKTLALRYQQETPGPGPRQQRDGDIPDHPTSPRQQRDLGHGPDRVNQRLPLERPRGDYEDDEVCILPASTKRPRLDEVRELIRKEVQEAGLCLTNKDGPATLRLTLSPLSPDILNIQFPRKFSVPTFEYYNGTSDPMQHLRHYQDKMAVYSYSDALLCRMFPSSLKGLASDWFYSLKPGSISSFEQVARTFLSQYSSCQEYRKTSNHLFTLKMYHDESLKKYLTRFQTERAKVHSCSDDVAAAAFISGLRQDHSLYASLLKHNVTDMNEVLRRVPGYIRLEEAQRGSSNNSSKPSGKTPTDSSKQN